MMDTMLQQAVQQGMVCNIALDKTAVIDGCV